MGEPALNGELWGGRKRKGEFLLQGYAQCPFEGRKKKLRRGSYGDEK